jgi:hypothetical protein
MTLKDTLDKITEILRCIQYANQSKEELIASLQNLIYLVGQVLVQRDSATEQLQKYDNQLWISHICGQVECPECDTQLPIDFYVGSKGVLGKPLTAATRDELIELLEFPPITKDDLKECPIPDYMPDL